MTPGQPVSVTIRLTKPEFDVWTRWTHSHHPGWRQTKLLSGVLLLAGVALVSSADPSSFAAALGAGLVAYAIALPAYQLLRWRRALKRAWAVTQQQDRAEPDVLVFSDQGIDVSARAASGTLPWAAYREVVERPELYLLVQRNARSARVLPKRCFASLPDEAEFRRLAATHSRLIA